MTPAEALDIIGDGRSIRVVTRSGIAYDVYPDTIEANGDYVYGERITGPAHNGAFRRGPCSGSIKWFSLSNVTAICTGHGSDLINGKCPDCKLENHP